MLGKIDVRDIVRDHFRTLVEYRTGRPSRPDYMLFLVGPAIAATLLHVAGVRLSDAAITVFITAISILAGLLFNVLVLIHTVAERFESPVGEKDGRRLLHEVYSNIAYAILVCLISLIPLGTLTLTRSYPARDVADILSMFLTIHLFLTLLMVLKRLHALLSHELGRP
jgi:hypothetical protein